jgi:lipoyl(octanoyl) transferase
VPDREDASRSRPAPRRFRVLRLGRISYREALALQEAWVARRRTEEGEDLLALLEHDPVVTLGRRAREDSLRVSPGALARAGVDLLQVGRGGEATYHGPGQLIGYPIIDLDPLGRDLHHFLRSLEDVLIRVLKAFGIAGERIAGKTGVWVDGEKIASIGIGVRRWVTWHGFALNVAADLSGFSTIVPCGLPGVTLTSLERLLGRPLPLAEVEDQVVAAFAGVFGYRGQAV